MANLSNIIKLTRSQYEQLLAGTLTGKTYDANAVYLIESEYEDYILETIRWIYPIGSIYVNYTGVKPAWMDEIGTWTPITGRFLLMGDQSSSGADYNPIDTGGSWQRQGGNSTHTHTLSDGYAKGNIWSGNNQFAYAEVSNKPEYTQNQQVTTTSGHSGSATISSTYGIALGGSTDSANNMPPYEIVFGWRRIA